MRAIGAASTPSLHYIRDQTCPGVNTLKSAYLPTAEAHRNKAHFIAVRQKLWLDCRCVHDLAAGGGVKSYTFASVEKKLVHP